MTTKTITRTEFMKLTGASVVGVCAGSLAFWGCSAMSSAPLAPEGSYRREADLLIVSLAAVDELNTVGGAVRLALENGSGSKVKVLVVRSAADVYLAFANRCTHNGKELDYRHGQSRVQCISGKSHFDLAGNITKGPAEGALLRYPAHLDGDDLVIDLA